MSDYPVFCGPNAVNENSKITVSSGDAVKYRLYDRDYNTLWKTAGQNSDGSTASVEILFQENAVDALKNIDTVILQNCNAVSAIVEFYTGSVWGSAVTLNAVNRIGISLKAQFAVKQAYGIRITFSQTQVPNQEKQIGEVWALETLLVASKGFYSYEPVFSATDISTQMMDGGVKTALVKWSGDRVTRWGASLSFAGLSQAEADALLAVYSLGEFVVYPEPDALPQAIYSVSALKDSLSCGYVSKSKSGGLTVSFKAVES